MNLQHAAIQRFIPPLVFIFLVGRGWRGGYKSWAEAERLTAGYDAANILERQRAFIQEAISRANEQNPHAQRPWELLSALMWVAAQNKGSLNVIDFGGALGQVYYQNKIFLDQLESAQWNVVEQPHFIELGKREFENDRLKFFFSVDECVSQSKSSVDCVLFGSVLPYLEKTYDVLSGVLQKKIKHIFITRTYFTKNKPDQIAIQKVPKGYYDASYPCWILEEKKLLDCFSQHGYELAFDYEEKYQINIPSISKGMLFKLK